MSDRPPFRGIGTAPEAVPGLLEKSWRRLRQDGVFALLRVACSYLWKKIRPVDRNQVWPSRAGPMQRLVKSSFHRPVDALEIGTWFGLGSTRIWADTLPEGSTLTLVDAWRPYVSREDLAGATRGYRSMDRLTHAAMLSTLKVVYGLEKVGRLDRIAVVRAKSSDYLRAYRDGQFDFIYIDGSHYYADVLEDIRSAKRLARPEFAVICGDDYELPHSDELIALSRENPKKDFIYGPQGWFHPGVMLAIAEELSQVNVDAGFWWVYVRQGKISLS